MRERTYIFFASLLLFLNIGCGEDDGSSPNSRPAPLTMDLQISLADGVEPSDYEILARGYLSREELPIISMNFTYLGPDITFPFVITEQSTSKDPDGMLAIAMLLPDMDLSGDPNEPEAVLAGLSTEPAACILRDDFDSEPVELVLGSQTAAECLGLFNVPQDDVVD